MLMGATLPAMSRWVQTTPEGVSWLGFFYGGNTGGAVIGSLLAGFYLLRVHDMATATFVAVALNVSVAVLAILVARAVRHDAAAVATGHGQGCARILGRVRRHRALRHDGAGVRGHLDAPALAAVRRHRLHLLAHPGGLPVRHRHRQQCRIGARARPRAAAHRARLVSDAALRRHRLGRVYARALAARSGRSTRRSR